MNKLTIAVDVDDVCADLLTEWLRRYNRDHGDNLTPEDVDGWDLAPQVKTECGKLIYRYLHDDDLYLDIKPHPHALAAVELMRRAGHRVLFVTSCVVGSVDAKVHWLMDHGFLPHGNMQRDFIAASDKSLIRADYLIDDHVGNLEGLSERTRGILIERPHNRDVLWGGLSAKDLLEAAHRLAPATVNYGTRDREIL